MMQWEKSFGGSFEDYVVSIRQTADGGYVFLSDAASADGDIASGRGGEDYWVVKLNDTGAIQWEKSFGGTSVDKPGAIIQTSDKGYVVTGGTSSSDGDVTGFHGSADAWILKLDSMGVLQWKKCLGGVGNEYLGSVAQTANEGYILSGSIGDNYWIVRMNDTGGIQWQKSLGGTNDDQAQDIRQTTDGGYIVAGFAGSNNGDVVGKTSLDADYWVVKLNDTGAIQWQKLFGGTSGDLARSIQLTSDGGYIVAGRSFSNNGDVTGQHGNYDYWVVKLNDTGTLQWQKCMGGTDDEYLSAIQLTTDGGYILGGITRSTDGDVMGNHGSSEYWVVKLAPDPTAVFTPATAEGFSLSPNPATTEVRIQTGEAIRSVLVTDLTGKEVFRGGNTTIIPTAALANGLYFVRVQTASGIATQKVLVQH